MEEKLKKLLDHEYAPYSKYSDLFYGGGFKLMGIQLLGVISVLVWASVTILISFLLIKKSIAQEFRKKKKFRALIQPNTAWPVSIQVSPLWIYLFRCQ